jgi:DNA polymerase III sliding clamp (beta) subunit (PCNA family)
MVTLEANQKEVVLTQGDTVVRSRIVGGSFPRWRACFPSRNVTPNTVLASELLSASKQAGIVTSETSKSVFYSFTEEGVFLTAKSQECGESRVVCPIESLGMAVKVNLNPSFVEDIASRMDSVVEIEASDPESAVVFRSGNAFALISPVVVT